MSEKKNENGYKGRFREIAAVLHKHEISKGITPEKLRLILEDLGPTFVKVGQLMSLRSDILPKNYCDELQKLCSDVPPMPFYEVEEVLRDSFGYEWQEEFEWIDETPLGSASIAQVHRARLKTGEEVVIKVQRKGIYETMARDIGLMHKLVSLVPPISITDMVDFKMVLNELWKVTQEEMNFIIEAGNMEEFKEKNRDVAFVDTPVLFKEYTTSSVIVMEYIDGYAIDDKEHLLEDGYDMNEIGSKYVDNFIKQVMDDGFFHAEQIAKAVEGVAFNDIGMIQDAVLALGEFRGEPDPSQLYKDIRGLMAKYGTADMGNIDVAEVLQDLMDVMKENKITMPHGLTMLARGLAHVEGVLADISPQINMVEIAASRLKSQFIQNHDWKKEAKSGAKSIYLSMRKAVDIPALVADLLDGYMKGQTRINLDLHAGEDLANLLRRVTRNVVMGLWVMALLISSSIICTTDMKPKILGIPALGAIGYLGASVIVLYVFIKHIFSRK